MIANDLKYKLADVNAAMARHAKARKPRDIERLEGEVWTELEEFVREVQMELVTQRGRGVVP